MALSRISSAAIANNAVIAADILDGSLTGAKLASSTITGDKIAANTISNTNIATGAVENYLNAAGLGFGMRNRIINGAMVIDQRNAGASITVNDAAAFFPADRWECQAQSADGVYTAQQVTTVPAGFKNSLKITVTTADSSIGATQSYMIRQKIEGNNIADLGWGASGAATVTLSFWVRSSLTGTFGGALINGGFSRSYPFSYTISAADTWEQKTVTIAGDTTGTWATDNTTGIVASFSLGAGSSRVGTAGAWVASNTQGVTGQVSLIGTNGATFYITGVQLEKGSTATSFDYRPYGTELALCQRYYQKYGGSSGYIIGGYMSGSNDDYGNMLIFPVVMRASPTSSSSGTWGTNNTTTSNPKLTRVTNFGACVYAATSATGNWYMDAIGADNLLTFSAEL